MLVLTRKKEESIVIGDDIKIKVLDIDKNSVKIGIVAPNNISILREELIDMISQMNKKAVMQSQNDLIEDLVSISKNDKPKKSSVSNFNKINTVQNYKKNSSKKSDDS